MGAMEPNWRYNVFLCFRGQDTRYTFTGSLYNALRDKRLKVFMDRRELKSGDEISPALLKSCEESRISVVVLSQNFAFSTWCLAELVKILECKKTKNQLVLPIFYDVDPSHVRHQTGTYGEAMTYQKTRFREDYAKVHRWSLALSEVAHLTGWHFKFKIGEEYEYELIQKIVEWITKRVTRYDVFLSFGGKDTCYSFTGYLYQALDREGFKIFMKDKGWEDRDQSPQSLVTVIEKSRLSIIVLSDNYANSSSCLDELVTILDFMKIKNQLVWPIFYKVEPSNIRNQRNSYGEAMMEHENKFGKDSEKVQTWRSALSEVANLKGWYLKFGDWLRLKMGQVPQKLERRPMWAVAVVCFVMLTVSIIIEHSIEAIGKWLKKKHKRLIMKHLKRLKEVLLACHDGFLLGPWLESAKQLAQNKEQERQNEGADATHEPKTGSTSNKYDVFLSFREEDTRWTFTGNLYHALRHKRIKTFLHDSGDQLQVQLSPSILNAIQESRISIIVLSKNYASSTRCLDELVNILECMKMNDQLVWPIFYKVEPSDVRRQRYSFGEAMATLEVKFQDNYPERMRRWKEALFQVGNLAGWPLYETEYEYEFIKTIVESAVQSLPRYDVFLSFCGEDTRYSFTGFLYQALRREGFKTFMDDEGLEGGNQISKTLLEAIDKSRLSIVVFSENYGYSTWCLDELVKIIECMKTKNQLVWPIFYKIEKSHVSNQTKSYGDAMTAHENRFGKDSEKVQKWRSALSQVTFLEGEHVKENEFEYDFIKKIVEKAIDVENHL